METEFEGLKISKNWNCIMPFSWFVHNARFIFTYRSCSSNKIDIVTRIPLEKMDCFEIGYDRFGLTINADTVFSNAWGEMITDSSKEIIAYIKDYLKAEGADDLMIGGKPWQ